MFRFLKTALLLSILFAIYFSFTLLLGTDDVHIAALIASMLIAASCVATPGAILGIYRARELDRAGNSEVVQMVGRLADAAGIATPRLYVVDHPQPNAFAVGWHLHNSAVVLSSSLLERLTVCELAGVMAHELAHIRSRDTLLMTMTAIPTAAIVSTAALLALLGYALRRDGGLILVVLAGCAALFTLVVKFAIGREREYQADAAGADICGHPEWLISALHKLGKRSTRRRSVPGLLDCATAHLLFVSPLSEPAWHGVFATHPPIAERIARLEMMVRRRSP